MEHFKQRLLPKGSSKKSRNNFKSSLETKKLDSKFKDGLELGYEKMTQKYAEKHTSQINDLFYWNKHPDEPVSALHIASAGHSKNIVEILLNNKANVNQITHSGKNALHFAAKFTGGKAALIDVLVDNGIEINKKDINDKTPLLIAVENNNVEAVKCLIKNFADDPDDTALKLAKTKTNSTMTGLLSGKKEEGLKDERIKELENELKDTKVVMEGMKESVDTNLIYLKDELRKSNDKINLLVQRFSQPGCRHSFAGIPSDAGLDENNEPLFKTTDDLQAISPLEKNNHGLLIDVNDETLRQQDCDVRAQLAQENEDAPLDKIEKYNINRNYDVLVYNLKTEEAIISMIAKGIISHTEKAHIQSLSTKIAQSDHIFSNVILKGSKGQLWKFVEVLEATKQTHLAQIIKGVGQRVFYNKAAVHGVKSYQSDSILTTCITCNNMSQ